jgi:hypothetical protein
MKYNFSWTALFNDGTKIDQFDNNGIENLFKLVQDKIDLLCSFSLSNSDGKVFIVDLKEGLIEYNNLIIVSRNLIEISDIKLIFFKRHFVTIGTKTLKEENHNIEYHLGFSYLDKNQKEQIIKLIIDTEGNFVMGS